MIRRLLYLVCAIFTANTVFAQEEAEHSPPWVNKDGIVVKMAVDHNSKTDLSNLTESQAKELVAKLAHQGVWLNPRVAWPYVEHMSTALGYWQRSQEPLDDASLESLNMVFQEHRDDATIFPISLFLYRYHNVQSHQWMIKHLNIPEVFSTLILNKDLSSIDSTDWSAQKFELSDEDLIALATWNPEGIKDYLLLLFEKQPRRSSRIAAIALADIREATPLLSKVAEAKQGSLIALGALVRFEQDVDKNWDRIMTYVNNDMFHHAPETISLINAIELSSHAEGPSALKLLVKRIKENMPLESRMGGELLASAILAYSRMQAATDENQANEFIEAISRSSPEKSTDFLTAFAFIEREELGDSTVMLLEEKLGSNFQEYLAGIAVLRKIPVSMLPDSSQWLRYVTPAY